ncbi:hypothetical protein [Isoalcanivorax indicus]|uniref:hypothetical protein n=1 Tax=Isoalcanivorax indicus TaxID=2202653 RepID=UPI000DB93B8E|nr:hypothetical protein [Isoalcanivorax indicus]
MPARTATADRRRPARPGQAQATLIAGILALLVLTAQAAPPPRPDISHYADTQAFVADMLAWQRQYGDSTDMAQGTTDAPSDTARYEKPWHQVTGPEDLEQAVRNADGYQQPRYPEPRRFNRTTHISFPLSPLPAERMASEALEGALYASPESVLDGLQHPPLLRQPGDDDERFSPRTSLPPPLPTPERDTAVRVQLR